MSHPRHGSQFPGTGGGAVLFIRRLSVKVPIAPSPVFVSADKAPRGRLTARYHGYIIADKSDKGQDAALRVEMGNVGLQPSPCFAMRGLRSAKQPRVIPPR